jgi:hypothetical protein
LKVEQVGGTHYQAEVQHWDVIEAYDVSYLEATATKYITRARKKGGLQDWRKALTYLQKMGGREVRRRVPLPALSEFIRANELDGQEAFLITLVLAEAQGRAFELALAESIISDVIRKLEREHEPCE